jgi:hypothetical protein
MVKAKVAVKGSGEIHDDGRFVPTEFTDDGHESLGAYPKCFGHYISGRKCCCEWAQACVMYTYDNIGERSRTIRFQDFETVRFREGMDFVVEEDNSKSINVNIDGAEDFDVSDINLKLIMMMAWFAIEKPGAAKALVLKLDPRVKCLEDIAAILGISKQAVQRRVAYELGIGKRHFKEEKVLKLREIEVLVYQMHFKGGRSLRKTGAMIGISYESVRKIAKKLERLGFPRNGNGSDVQPE